MTLLLLPPEARWLMWYLTPTEARRIPAEVRAAGGEEVGGAKARRPRKRVVRPPQRSRPRPRRERRQARAQPPQGPRQAQRAGVTAALGRQRRRRRAAATQRSDAPREGAGAAPSGARPPRAAAAVREGPLAVGRASSTTRRRRTGVARCGSRRRRRRRTKRATAAPATAREVRVPLRVAVLGPARAEATRRGGPISSSRRAKLLAAANTPTQRMRRLR